MSQRFVQTPPITLYSSIAASAVSMRITPYPTDLDGANLDMNDFGATPTLTIDPKVRGIEEIISFTGITDNGDGTATLTGLTRNVGSTYPYSATLTGRQHAASAVIVFSNNPQMYSRLASKENDETVTGAWNFSQVILGITPTLPAHLATKAYADALAIAGAPNASTSVQGLVQEATQAQMDARTVTGSTAAKLFVPLDKIRSTKLSDYVASDTGSANAYAIAPTPVFTAYAAGQRFVFKATNANTAASTLNVNALGVKTIKKLGTLDLGANDIIAGQIIEVLYDGTNMVLMTPIASNVTPTGLVVPFAGLTIPSGWLLCDGSAVSRTTYAALLAVISPAATFTVTLASPGVFAATAHGLNIGDKIRLTTTGALPTGLAVATDYFVITAGFTANAFQVSASRGGAAVNTSGSQSGVHTFRYSNYGVGDGSTTFNVPSYKGKTLYGQDTTDTNFDNLNSPTVYAGEKTHVLTVGELASHTHAQNGVAVAGGGAGLTGSLSNSTTKYVTDATGSDTAHNNLPPYAVSQYIIKT